MYHSLSHLCLKPVSIDIPRDLKPDNVLVTEFMSSKISDFGTSRAKSQTYNDVAMTAVGTPLYCAPEVLSGETYDEKVFMLLTEIII